MSRAIKRSGSDASRAEARCEATADTRTREMWVKWNACGQQCNRLRASASNREWDKKKYLRALQPAPLPALGASELPPPPSPSGPAGRGGIPLCTSISHRAIFHAAPISTRSNGIPSFAVESLNMESSYAGKTYGPLHHSYSNLSSDCQSDH